MIWELLAMLASGAAVAGVVMMLRVIFKNFIPKWVTPAAAALAMIAFSINAEYAWYPRNLNAMPAGFVEVKSSQTSAWYRPWTKARPYTNTFMAVDKDTVLTNPAMPGAKLASVYVFTRNGPLVAIPVVFDCAGKRRADLPDGAALPGEDDWRDLADNDPFLAAVCEA
jgi:hypothetical protein